MSSPGPAPLTPQDEVDRIVRAWSEELPTLDVEPMHVFSRLHRLARHIQDVRRDAFAEHGLAVWQFDVLAALRRAGDPYELTPGRLVTETRVSSGTMTNRIDRLVERGLVARRGSPGDRRIVLVRLTEAGSAAVDAAVTDLVARERALLDALATGGAHQLAALLRTMLEPFAGTPVPDIAEESE
ncbi:MarR family winged helix-turn-helix transcriptional regulator [Litorihabitans aurantiacus]|uniref:MarR family transcriptional regulator n=1 Tax=Litorihabitans aurantiacus TaxID=1930061 RepID=A0AA37UU17_9MICO|nr:MarR family transcriptional regulator [Litorihabitans aurantiacus]GMA30477.1 MarR family transcriptional regulator [Litorihabitans aurantiacus]